MSLRTLSPSFWRQQRVLVTGGGGFLGSFLIDRLRRLNCGVLEAPRRAEVDLRQASAIDALFQKVRPTLILHAAAASGGIGANRKRPGEFFYDNSIMGIQLLEFARRHGVLKVVQVGSVCEYPKITPVPFRETSLWEGYPEETNAPYGIAKKMMLVQSQAYRTQYGFNSVHLLLANLYGPRDNFDLESSHAIPALIRKCLDAKATGGPVSVWGSGRASREWLYVDDAARAILLAAEHYNGDAPVNVGTGEEIPMIALVQTIVRVCGYEGPVNWDTSRPDGQPRRGLEVSQAKKLFGYAAEISLEEGLRRTLAWYQEQR